MAHDHLSLERAIRATDRLLLPLYICLVLRELLSEYKPYISLAMWTEHLTLDGARGAGWRRSAPPRVPRRERARQDEFADPVLRSRTRTATTSYGNRYVLIGEPSENGLDDELVLAWLAARDLSRHDVEVIGVEIL